MAAHRQAHRQAKHNLPAELTSFIGRQLQVAELMELLSSTRLLTLSGTGGVGKTRLARRVAGGLLDRFPDGVWWVDLAPISDSALVPKSVASALSLREQPRRPLIDTLRDALHASELLIVLDNCEHLLDSCADLVYQLLDACPRLNVLATSRERLRLAGEAVWLVPSLSSPNMRDLQAPDAIQHYEAVQLFVERARLLDPTFALDDHNAAAVAELCFHLDGIPLAVELAAARSDVLSVQAIVERLDDRFRLLTAGRRSTIPRHQTLQAAIDWSHALLSAEDQAVFRRLSVFAGGCTLDAAESVCAADGIRDADVLDLLAHLVAKSLVIADKRVAPARYTLLETIRQYADVKLRESDETDRVRCRHRDWYLDLAERAAPELTGPNQLAWLDRLQAEHDNLRSALEWCETDPAGGDAGVRLVAALGRFWHWRGHVAEGCAWFSRALGRAGGSDSIRTTAYWEAALLEWRNANPEIARAMAERSIELARATGDANGLSNALRYFACIALEVRDFAVAEAAIEESAAIAREADHQRNLAYALAFIAFLRYLRGQLSQAHQLLEEVLAIARQLRDAITINNTLVQLGGVVLGLGDAVAAREHFEEALGIARRLDFKDGVADAVIGLGDLALSQADHRAAAGRYGEGLDNYLQAGERLPLPAAVERCAALGVSVGRCEVAARLFGAADASFELTAASIPPRTDTLHQKDVRLAREALGDPTFSALWQQGQALGLERAVKLAIEFCEQLIREPASAADEAAALSGRERGVLELLARGYSNRQIADELVIGVRTVETHVERVLRKLGLQNRAQAMLWVRDHRASGDQYANP